MAQRYPSVTDRNARWTLATVSRVACQYYLAQTLDGYLAESDGGLDWLTQFQGEADLDVDGELDRGPMAGGYDRFYAEVGALVMGSVTYEWILAHDGDWPYGGKASWVFSSRELTVPEDADIRFASGQAAPALKEARAAAGEHNVWLVGGGQLATQFVEEGLLEELHLTVVPVVLGEGIPTFTRRLRDGLRLRRVRPYRNGMVELRYDFER